VTTEKSRRPTAVAQAPPAEPRRDAAWTLEQVEEALRGLRYGTVTITVQDGVVVQVERLERRRFQK
jgi:hypothetical protein